MSTALLERAIEPIWTLTVQDRCDRCGSQGYVAVKGITGQLTFCGHHYNKIMNDRAGYEKMMSFAIQIIDEIPRLLKDSTIS